MSYRACWTSPVAWLWLDPSSMAKCLCPVIPRIDPKRTFISGKGWRRHGSGSWAKASPLRDNRLRLWVDTPDLGSLWSLPFTLCLFFS